MDVNLEKITESTASRAISRLAIILLVPLIGLIAYFARSEFENIKDTQKAFWGQISKQNAVFDEVKNTLSKIDTNVSVAATKYDSHTKDDDRFETTTEKALTDHDLRLRLIERSIPPSR